VDSQTLAKLREQQRPVVIGLGAIGSWVARWLVASGIEFQGYDDDVVSLKNLAAGAFEEKDVGRYKAATVAQNHAHRRRWSEEYGLSGTALLCADHGPTRRSAARVAKSENARFICAKANGSQWQVWHVDKGESPEDFIAFDEAAEANPVLVPCGDASVGRIASLGAAAELLSVWSGVEITPAEVEAAWGVKFDPALSHFAGSRWKESRSLAENNAQEAAELAFKRSIDSQRDTNDEQALSELRELRERRQKLRREQRTTIHQRGVYHLDDGVSARRAAQTAVGTVKVLSSLVQAESRCNANKTGSSLGLPETIELVELSA